MDKFFNKKQWVNWKYEKVDGKVTKVPYQPNGRRAASTRPNTWSTYGQVKAASQNIGIVFTPEKLLVGVDIDHCIKTGKIEHEEKEKIADFILAADTYTETSPSQTGLHFYFIVTEAFTPIANKHAPYEIYSGKRFFTVTEQPYGEKRDIRTVTPDELEKLLSILGYPWGKEKVEVNLTQSNSTSELDDATVIKKMMRNAKTKKLHEGDISDYNNDDSSGDMAYCMHLAYWTNKDAAQMERLWLASPLGQRKKTQDRQDYRTRTINNAIAKCDKVYESPAAKLKRENPELDLLCTFNKNGDKIPVQNLENMCRILRDHEQFSDRFRHDEFTNTLEIKKDNVWQQFKDSDVLDVQSEISIEFPSFIKVGKDMVFDAIIKVATENKIDSAKDYLTSLVWDKKYRLDQWLHHTYGTPDDEYHQSVGSNWMKGLVHRLIEPGCKFDYVLVLEGKQGIRKSTSLYVLGGPWHVETTMSTDSKDFFMQFSGKAIIEFSEGETLSRTEVKKMKAIITMQTDKYRPPYERTSRDFPRRCVFAMTTNQTEYLKDETGNRRWLPVKCLKPADLEWLKTNRDQLFAEAYHRLVVKKETTFEFPEEALSAEQAARRIIGPWEELIFTWYMSLTEAERNFGITTQEAYVKGVQKSQAFSKEIGTYESMIVGETLRSALKLERKRTMEQGERSYKYYPSEDTLKLFPTTIPIADLAEETFKKF